MLIDTRPDPRPVNYANTKRETERERERERDTEIERAFRD